MPTFLVFFIQLALPLGFGLGLPFLAAYVLWKKNPPKKFPRSTALMLMFVSILGFIIGSALDIQLGNFDRSVAIHGDNSTAAMGTTVALFLLVPSYWMGLQEIFRKLDAGRDRAP